MLWGSIHSDSPVGLIEVKRRWKKYKTFFLFSIAERVKESQIYSYVTKSNISSNNVYTFQSKRKGSMLAKINIPLTSCSSVLEISFWLKFVYCKPWQQKDNEKQNALQKNSDTLMGIHVT